MNAVGAIDVAEVLQSSQSLLRLSSLLRDQSGLTLFVLALQKHAVVPIFPEEFPTHLPEFCTVLQQTPAGRQRCAGCRCTIALRSHTEHATEFACYGEIRTLVLPVQAAAHVPVRLILKTSGYLRQRPHSSWKGVKRSLVPLGVDVNAARAAYLHLPLLSPERIKLVEDLLQLGASIVADQTAEVARRWKRGQNTHPQPGPPLLLEHLEQLRDACQEGSCHVSGESPGAALVHLLVAVIHEHPENAYTLGRIARELHLSPNHLSTLFHRHYGVPFSTFLTQERLALARRRLQEPHYSVSEVAYASGFQNASYFCRCFKQHTGMTPGQWRAQEFESIGQRVLPTGAGR